MVFVTVLLQQGLVIPKMPLRVTGVARGYAVPNSGEDSTLGFVKHLP